MLLLQVMAAKGETEWRSEKTLAECMQYTLNSDLATAVYL